MNYTIHTDGGSRGNPGPAAVGVVIEISQHDVIASDREEKKLLTAFGKTIGITTNNVAEYTAVIEALKWVLLQQETRDREQGEDDKKSGSMSIQFYLDSTLVVHQLNGLFKVKDANMRMLMLRVRELEQQIPARITYAYVPREQNSDADFQVNKALDAA